MNGLEVVFGRGWSLSVASPIVWAFLDLAVTQARADQTYLAISQMSEGLVFWFLCAPIWPSAWSPKKLRNGSP